MNRKKTILFSLLLLLTIVFILLDLMLGSVVIRNFFNIVFSKQAENAVFQKIIFDIRLPSALTALGCGMALSISGLLMQTFFKNPLADPSILGISSGASLGVGLTTLLMGNALIGTFLGNSIMVVTAFIGALSVLLMMVVFSRKFSNNTLLLIGVMISYSVSSIIGILQFYATNERLHAFVIWGMGSFKNTCFEEAVGIVLLVVILLIPTFLMSKNLNIYILGKDYATNLGLNYNRFSIQLVFLSGMLVAIITAFCGPIAFIGLMVPHFSRMIFKTFDHKILIPASLLIGGVVALFCDIVSGMPGMNSVLPINAITSLIGAPIVIWMIFRNKKLNA
ncbi:MAG: iron ABC transporter permease [Bacteroidales bacterium]|nr:iron ABC transporter permease [Bacteroidales bacterium]